MAAEPVQPRLTLVETPQGLANPETGQIFEHPLEARVAELGEDLANAEGDLRIARARIKKLEADKQHERNVYVLRTTVEDIFEEWKEKCKHTRSKLDPARFDAIRAMLEKGYTREDFTRAIEGAAYDPFTKRRKNGTMERFDDIELVCRDAVHFERFANRRPAPAQGKLL